MLADEALAGGLGGELVIVQADEMAVAGQDQVDLQARPARDAEAEVGAIVRGVAAVPAQLMPLQPYGAGAVTQADAFAHAARARCASGISRSLARSKIRAAAGSNPSAT